MHQYIRQFPSLENQTATIKGWVANSRDSKGLVFLVMRDGSGFAQCVVSEETVGAEQFALAKSLTQESAVALTGTVLKDERQVGGYELQVTGLQVYSIPTVEYPITPKEHGVEFLGKKRHLWLRSRRQWAIMRVRNEIIMGIHAFFQERGFVQMDAPILTGNACEGTSELFATDFYGDPAYLSQSGQLYGEAMAMAQGLIYTFGPTFRAEKSVTRRHLSEFWMIEPEMAFYDLEMNMALIEDFIRSVVTRVLDRCKMELQTLERDTTMLEKVAQPFPRITHAEAVKILRGEKAVNGRTALEMLDAEIARCQDRIAACQADIAQREIVVKDTNEKKGVRNFNQAQIDKLKQEIADLEEQLRNLPKWRESAATFPEDGDFGNSDETVLTRMFDAPVMVYNWPTKIKAFYMKEVEGDPEHVKGVDVLAPEGFGEIVGGSERETDLSILTRKIEEHKLPMEAFEWYLDLRRFGSVPHAGFGLGLERFVAWMCNIQHIREAIPFQRRYGWLFP